MSKDDYIGLCKVLGCYKPAIEGLDVCIGHQKEFSEAKLQRKGKLVKSQKKAIIRWDCE